MKKISYVHIILNLSVQIISWIFLAIAYCISPLIYFTSDEWDSSWESFETSWLVKTPPPDDEFHIYYKFITGELDCMEMKLTEKACDAINRSVISNNILLVCFLVGSIAAIASMIWTYYQLKGYFHKATVSQLKLYVYAANFLLFFFCVELSISRSRLDFHRSADSLLLHDKWS